MIKHVRKFDRAIIQFLNSLGIPTLAQMDKVIEKAEDKLWKGVREYKTDENSFFMSYLLLVGFAVVTIGSTASLYVLNIPEIAKDGLRLTTAICILGIAGVVLHLGFKKILGEK